MDELILAARGGDPSARNQLLTLLRPRLRQWAEAALSERLAARIDASDLTQITLLDVHRRLGQFMGSTEGELVEWLKRALQRNIIDEVRRATAQKRDLAREQRGGSADDGHRDLVEQIPAHETSPGSKLVLLEDSERVRQALRALPPAQQEAVRLVFIERMPVPEVAQRMGRSRGAVAKLLSRGIETLRARLNTLSAASHPDDDETKRPRSGAPKQDSL